MMQINFKTKSNELTTNTWKAFSNDMEVSVIWPEVMTPLTEINRNKNASMSGAGDGTYWVKLCTTICFRIVFQCCFGT